MLFRKKKKKKKKSCIGLEIEAEEERVDPYKEWGGEKVEL
jgi:hypothetical protein